MLKDLQILPQVKDSISYLYLEKASIVNKDSSIMAMRETGNIPIPVSSLTCLMLGPGVNITHSAIKVIAENGCMIVWCGERGSHFYASGLGETRSSENTMIQAKYCMDEELHMRVVRRMYEIRFSDQKSSSSKFANMTLEAIRGFEGSKVKAIYKQYARLNGVPWSGRKNKGVDWDSLDPANKAISSANSILYHLCHAVILSLGYSTALGFIHNDKSLSFVYDIADIYKARTTIPAAFEAVHKNKDNPEKELKRILREYFHKIKIMKRIAKDIEFLFSENEDKQKKKIKSDAMLEQEEDNIIFFDEQDNDEVATNGSDSD